MPLTIDEKEYGYSLCAGDSEQISILNGNKTKEIAEISKILFRWLWFGRLDFRICSFYGDTERSKRERRKKLRKRDIFVCEIKENQ